MVRADLSAYEVAEPPSGTTTGVPWSDAKVRESIARLSTCLVTPYKQRFHLKDSVAEMRASTLEIATYWVVARSESFLQFYDVGKQEYGLAVLGNEEGLPETIGVRGDLVGVFGAM
jgi:hypothetical protein